MNISLDTLRTLDANKSYYLANSTGEIKEAGAWQRFKCALGIGDGRTKVARLVEAVKTSLLEAAGQKQDATLNESLAGLNTNKSLSGQALSQIARTFSAANADRIGKIQAEKAVRLPIFDAMRELTSAGEVDAAHAPFAEKILKHAVKDLIDHPPTHTDGTLDLDRLNIEATRRLSAATHAISEIASNEALGRPQLNTYYAAHVIDTLFGPDGQRNDRPVTDLKPANALLEETVQAKGQFALSRNELPKEPVIALMRFAIAQCGDDPDVLETIVEAINQNVLRGDDTLRTEENVADRIGKLKANFNEMRSIAKEDRKLYESGKAFLRRLGGKSLPPGMLTKMVEAARSTPPLALASVRPNAGLFQLHSIIRDYRNHATAIFNQSGVLNVLEGGDETTPARRFIDDLLFSKVDYNTKRTIQLSLETPQAARLSKTYSEISFGRHPKDGLTLEEVSSISLEASACDATLLELKGFIDTDLGDENVSPHSPAKQKLAVVEEGDAADVLDEFFAYANIPEERRP